MMATVMYAGGRHAEALHAVLDAQSKAGVSQANPAGRAGWPLAVESALRVPDLQAAEDLLAPFLARRPGRTPPLLAGLRLRFKARLAAARGEPADVERDFNAAVAIFRDAEMPFHQAVTQLELAEWLSSQGKVTSSASPLQEAHAIFEKLKALPWLERVALAAAAAPA